MFLEAFLTTPEEADEFHSAAWKFFGSDLPFCSVAAVKALPNHDQLIIICAIASRQTLPR